MTKMKVAFVLPVALAMLAMSGTAMAEVLGLLNGRSANLNLSPEKSVEVGFIADTDDYQRFGARFNYKFQPNLLGYVDLGQSDFDIVDSLDYGVGIFHQLADVMSMPTVDVGIHFSVHRASFKYTRYGYSYFYGYYESKVDTSLTSIMLDAQFSGKNAINAEGNVFWNASVGVNRASFSPGGSDTELALGAGLSMQTGSQSGEFYGGLFYIDGMGFGAGYRHYLN